MTIIRQFECAIMQNGRPKSVAPLRLSVRLAEDGPKLPKDCRFTLCAGSGSACTVVVPPPDQRPRPRARAVTEFLLKGVRRRSEGVFDPDCIELSLVQGSPGQPESRLGLAAIRLSQLVSSKRKWSRVKLRLEKGAPKNAILVLEVTVRPLCPDQQLTRLLSPAATHRSTPRPSSCKSTKRRSGFGSSAGVARDMSLDKTANKIVFGSQSPTRLHEARESRTVRSPVLLAKSKQLSHSAFDGSQFAQTNINTSRLPTAARERVGEQACPTCERRFADLRPLKRASLGALFLLSNDISRQGNSVSSQQRQVQICRSNTARCLSVSPAFSLLLASAKAKRTAELGESQTWSCFLQESRRELGAERLSVVSLGNSFSRKSLPSPIWPRLSDSSLSAVHLKSLLIETVFSNSLSKKSSACL